MTLAPIPAPSMGPVIGPAVDRAAESTAFFEVAAPVLLVLILALAVESRSLAEYLNLTAPTEHRQVERSLALLIAFAFIGWLSGAAVVCFRALAEGPRPGDRMLVNGPLTVGIAMVAAIGVARVVRSTSTPWNDRFPSARAVAYVTGALIIAGIWQAMLR